MPIRRAVATIGLLLVALIAAAVLADRITLMDAVAGAARGRGVVLVTTKVAEVIVRFLAAGTLDDN
jgi:hypothetical protein